jgi:hypothetical protein
MAVARYLSPAPCPALRFGPGRQAAGGMRLPQEHIVKAFTLGASDFDIAYRVVFKQILPTS